MMLLAGLLPDILSSAGPGPLLFIALVLLVLGAIIFCDSVLAWQIDGVIDRSQVAA